MKGFDPFFFAHMEEIDLCWRIQLAGYKIYSCPQSVIFHVGGGTLPKGNQRKVFLNFRNNLVMLMKNLPLASRIRIIPARIFLNIVAAFFFLLKGHGRKSLLVLKSIFAACWWGIAAKKPYLPKRRKLSQLKGVFRGSLLTAYHVGKKTSFSRLNKKLLR